MKNLLEELQFKLFLPCLHPYFLQSYFLFSCSKIFPVFKFTLFLNSRSVLLCLYSITWCLLRVLIEIHHVAL